MSNSIDSSSLLQTVEKSVAYLGKRAWWPHTPVVEKMCPLKPRDLIVSRVSHSSIFYFRKARNGEGIHLDANQAQHFLPSRHVYFGNFLRFVVASACKTVLFFRINASLFLTNLTESFSSALIRLRYKDYKWDGIDRHLFGIKI